MANWSSASVLFTGTKENIKKAQNKIKSIIITEEDSDYLIPTMLFKQKEMDSFTSEERAGLSSAQLLYKGFEKKSLSLGLSGRWNAPDGFFKTLAKDYGLSGLYIDSEPGCDYFFKLVFVDGETIEIIERPYFCVEHIEEEGVDYFLEEYNWVFEDENWEKKHKKIIDVFIKYGLTLEELKKDCE